MAGEVIRIAGEKTGLTYVHGCAPDADELATAYFANKLFDIAVKHRPELDVDESDKLRVEVLNPDFTDESDRWKP
jgi:hypothetical protein